VHLPPVVGFGVLMTFKLGTNEIVCDITTFSPLKELKDDLK
jgi:hypothetical protein